MNKQGTDIQFAICGSAGDGTIAALRTGMRHSVGYVIDPDDDTTAAWMLETAHPLTRTITSPPAMRPSDPVDA